MSGYSESNQFAQKETKKIRQEKEQEILKNVRKEREILRDKVGVERYFTPDPTNPIDQEIINRLRVDTYDHISMEERKCRIILAKRLGTGLGCNLKKEKIEAVIETRIDAKCLRYHKTRSEVVREAFCTHFNIKRSV